MDDDSNFRSSAGMVIGGFGSIAVAGMLTAFRDSVLNANVALVLMIVVVAAAAVGGRAAGAVSAGIATLSFDFFYTKPYNSLRMDSWDDVETALLLLVGALIVGQLAARVRAGRAAVDAGRLEIAGIRRLADLVARGVGSFEVAAAAQDELTALLSLAACRFELPPFEQNYEKIERSGIVIPPRQLITVSRMGRQGFELPVEGAELPVLRRGQQVARFILVPTAGVGASIEQRVVAVAFADQVGAAFEADSPSAGSSNL